MRPRVVMLLAFLIAAVAVGFTGARFTYLPSPHPPAHGYLPPSVESYLGVFEPGSPPSYQPIDQFSRAVNREPNLVGFYSGWAAAFPTSFAEMVHSHGLIPFVQIDPTYASVPEIAAGAYDPYLKLYADDVVDYGHQVVIGFGHEMNAPFYKWGYGWVAPQTFVAAWRHIVRLFKAEGALNVTWLWTIQVDGPGTGPIASWWPGSSYVTWVGIDGYYERASDTFTKVFTPTINQVRVITDKPILLSETAVGRHPDQYPEILNLFEGIAQYRLLGLVWFDKDQIHDVQHQDWRIEGNPVAESAFQTGVSGLRLVATSP